MLKDRNLDLFK